MQTGTSYVMDYYLCFSEVRFFIEGKTTDVARLKYRFGRFGRITFETVELPQQYVADVFRFLPEIKKVLRKLR